MNETAALVLDAKRSGGKSAIFIRRRLAEDFALQTEPQIQEVLGIEEKGHDYFMQFTDAGEHRRAVGGDGQRGRPWGKVDPTSCRWCASRRS